jgi:hypothetical protein
MAIERKRALKAGQRVVMREAPCSSCPPWTRRYVGKGYKGKIASWSDVTHSYWVEFDQIPGEATGLCTRHLEAEKE